MTERAAAELTVNALMSAWRALGGAADLTDVVDRRLREDEDRDGMPAERPSGFDTPSPRRRLSLRWRAARTGVAGRTSSRW
ncbi:hypothetical protein E1218_20780 [Kribbella turkmenica]|uniref:Uncharacterized protein n=1 Tax=Kribbella turkmenica TaxID=2530375 RepID=A0A4R4WUZ3_9ACTN|nr:hypothetical protein [Kribbella turkmenica]TDD21455.1 hypothetical protein E1218_20780 [Kribbella turkmenica]